MIITLMNNKVVKMPESKYEAIKAAIVSGQEYLELDDMLIKVSAVMSVESSQIKESSYDQPQLAPPTTELSDEARKANMNKISEMRQKFTNRLA